MTFFSLMPRGRSREHLLYNTEYMGVREAVGGIKSAGGDACGVVTSSVLKSIFRIFL